MRRDGGVVRKTSALSCLTLEVLRCRTTCVPMGRDDGFPIADVAVGLLDDDKVRRLWRLLGDQSAMCEAMTTHEAVLLASWGAGHRVTVDDACPLWLTPRQPILEALRSVGLLDAKGRIPAKPWASYFGPASARREAAREAGRKGNAKRWGSGGDADAIGSRSPSLPSVPTHRPTPRARANGAAPRGGDMAKLGDYLAGTPLGNELGLPKKETA